MLHVLQKINKFYVPQHDNNIEKTKNKENSSSQVIDYFLMK